MAITGLTVSRVPTGDIDEGSSIALTVAWTNSVAGTHTVAITWGDGDSGTFSVPNGSPYSEIYYHVYRDNGLFNILANVSSGSSSALDGLDVTVDNVPPVINSVAGDLNNSDGIVDVLFTFSDVSDRDTTAGHTVVINWGDGLSDSYSLVAGTYTRSHTYASFPSGSLSYRRRLRLTVTDKDSDSDTELFYPVVTYYDDVDDTGLGVTDFYGIVTYYDDPDDTGIVDPFFDGIPFYSFDAEGEASSTFVSAALVGHASVFIVTADAECDKIGNIPFTQLVPSE
jgi:hypothetical protein